MWVYDAAVHAWRDQKQASDLLKLDFQLVGYEQGGCGFWELKKLGLLQEQQMPLIAESSLQILSPYHHHFVCFQKKFQTHFIASHQVFIRAEYVVFGDYEFTYE